MSNVKLAGNVSGTGSVTIASPNTNSDISISLPTVTGGSFIVSDSSGNVGIGTSSPAVKLDVAGNATIQNGVLTIGKDTVYDAFINTPESMYFNVDSDGNSTGNRFVWGTDRTGTSGGTEWMRIDSSGNVGIGTSSPDFKLTLQSGGDVQMSFKDSGGTTRAYIGTAGAFGTAPTGALRIRSDQGGIVFGISGAETARLDTSGNFQFNSGYGSVATAYGCRAWVNFNGTGTVAIRASGNVSSITDNGTGDYTVNFTTAMPDANYSAVVCQSNDVAYAPQVVAVNNKSAGGYANVTPTTSAFRFTTGRATDGSPIDALYALVSVFR